jgi:hypothetical protein
VEFDGFRKPAGVKECYLHSKTLDREDILSCSCLKIAMFRAYPSPHNPGPLRALFPLPGRFSGHIPAKKASLSHTFLKYAVSFGFEANGDGFFEL